jgi:hypothetical protein
MTTAYRCDCCRQFFEEPFTHHEIIVQKCEPGGDDDRPTVVETTPYGLEHVCNDCAAALLLALADVVVERGGPR